MRALAAFALLLAACSTPQSRIRRDPELFASFPSKAQASIRLGRVEPGFTPEMVRMAWGPPDRKYERRDAGGSREVWGYGRGGRAGSPGIGVSVGASGGSGAMLYGGGVTLGTGGAGYYEDRRSVVFEGGRVAAVEER